MHLLGTGGVELAAAFNWYLNDYLNATYDWNTYAEGQLPAALTASAVPELKMPGSGDGTAAAAASKAIPLPRPESSPVRPRAVPWSYYMNVCTYGYSLMFIPWDTDAADPKALHFAQAKVFIGLGRIFPMCYRSSTSYHIHEHIRCLSFWSDDAAAP